ncbi:hypothetical protein TIFTF001_002456 [Ficus carica]|uniref:Uncharacterized protein n=1 Tax=Ficus carica TaxID=3494 RepID=A0AA87ZMT9_FICCA|nr:hypothetical protein TIFTF001_002456 [Ficus carica]
MISTHRRSNGALLDLESISSECSRIASYERLPSDDRKACRSVTEKRSAKKKIGALGIIILSKVLSFAKDENNHNHNNKKTTTTGKKRRSTWLPDPERRWPVQGW